MVPNRDSDPEYNHGYVLFAAFHQVYAMVIVCLLE